MTSYILEDFLLQYNTYKLIMNKNYIKKIWCTDLGLSPFSNNQFYNILECIIIGWKLIPMPNKSEYKPHLVIYPLWENTFNKCMDSPLLLTPVKHKV